MAILLFLRFFAGLISLAILGTAVYLLREWWQGDVVRDADGVLRTVRDNDWRLWTGLGLLVFSLLGRPLVLMFLPKHPKEPQVARSEGHRVKGPNGADLWVETYGPEGGPTLVFTHGWGMDSSSWNTLKAAFADRYRLVMWDLPGLGRSKGPHGGKYSVEGFAADLRTVVEDSVGPGKVLLLGHSIGGMTVQTLLRDHPDFARERVAGVALIDTTYRNPIDTLVLSGLWRVLRFPLIEPMCWLMIMLSPVFHLMHWKSWLDGTAHIAMRLAGFGKPAPRDAVDHAARLSAYNAPGVQAKGDLAMFRWSVEQALPSFRTPTLILSGTHDIVTLPRASHHMASTIPGAELVSVDKAGHMSFMEQPKAYSEAIARFAERVLGGEGQGSAPARA